MSQALTTPSSIQAPSLPPPTPICDPQSPVTLQRVLIQVDYGSLLLGRGSGAAGAGGIDGKFSTPTQNAVKKFQQDNRIPVDGKVGPITSSL